MQKLVYAALGVALAAVTGYSLMPSPGGGQMAGHSMVPPDTSHIAQGAAIVEVKLPETLSTNAAVGRNVFEAKCAACHGADAAGRNGIGPPLIHPYYRPGHHPDIAFFMAAKNGVQAHHWRFGNMPPVQGLTDGDIKTVVAYIRELQRVNGID